MKSGSFRTGALSLVALGSSTLFGAEVYRWSPAEQTATVVTKSGNEGLSLTRDGLKVEASIKDTGTEIRLEIRIINRTKEAVPLDPSTFALEVISPKPKTLEVEAPEKVAKRMQDTAQMEVSQLGNGATFSSTVGEKQLSLEIAAKAKAHEIVESALETGSVSPGSEASGFVYFRREKKKTETLVRIPLGEYVFEFPFAWSKDRVLTPESRLETRVRN